MPAPPTVVAPDASVTDGVLAMGAAGRWSARDHRRRHDRPDGLQALVTAGDLAAVLRRTAGGAPARHPAAPEASRNCARSISARAPSTHRAPDRRGRRRVAGATDAPRRRGDRHADSCAGRCRPAAGVLVLLRIVGPRGIADEAGAAPRRHRRRRGRPAAAATAYASRARVRSPSATTCRASCRSRRRSTWRAPASGRARYRGWIRDPGQAGDVSRANAVRPASRARADRSLWQRLPGRRHRRRGPRLPARARQRLPGEPAAADVLRGRRRRQRRRAAARRSGSSTARCGRSSTSAACSAWPRGRCSGRSTLERFAVGADAAARARERSFARRPTRSASCCGSRAGSGSVRARSGAELPPALAQPPRPPRARRADSARSCGCSSSPPIAAGSRRL